MQITYTYFTGKSHIDAIGSSNTKRFVNILDENGFVLKYLASELSYIELKQDVKCT
jgi:hypothetical protein